MRIKPFFLPILLVGAATTASAEAPIVLSVSRDYQTILDAPATVQVITRAEIQALHYRNLAEVLNAQVGFHISQNYMATVAVRGYSVMGDFNSRVLVLYDNHPLTELQFNSSAITPFDSTNGLGIDLDQVRQIEIVRGPGFQLYGSGAMLAVINIIPHHSQSGGGGGASVEVGGLGYERYSAHATLAGERGLLNLQYLGQSMRGDDFVYRIPDEEGGEELVRINGRNSGKQDSMLLTLDSGAFRLTAMASQSLFEDGSGIYETHLGLPQPGTTSRAFVRLRYQEELGSSLRFYGRLSWDGYQFRGRYFYEVEPEEGEEPVSDPTGASDFYERDHAKDQWATAEAQLDWAAPGDQLITVGVQGQSQYMLYQENAAPREGGTYFKDERDITVLTAFVQDEWTPVSSVTLNGVIRYEHHSTFGDFWGPRASGLFRLSDRASLKANYGHGFRAPNQYELYYGDGFLYFGNEDLDPEIIDSFELTHEWAGERHRFQTSAFYSRLSDMIDQADGVRVIDGEEIEVITYGNKGKATSYGAEALWHFDGDSGRMFEVSGSWQRNKLEEGGLDTIVNSPQVKLALRAIQPLGGKGASLGWETWWLARRMNRDGSSVDPLTLCRAVVRMAPEGSAWRATAGADNLFDVTYDNPAISDQPQVVLPQSGRTFFLRGEVEF